MFFGFQGKNCRLAGSSSLVRRHCCISKSVQVTHHATSIGRGATRTAIRISRAAGDVGLLRGGFRDHLGFLVSHDWLLSEGISLILFLSETRRGNFSPKQTRFIRIMRRWRSNRRSPPPRQARSGGTESPCRPSAQRPSAPHGSAGSICLFRRRAESRRVPRSDRRMPRSAGSVICIVRTFSPTEDRRCRKNPFSLPFAWLFWRTSPHLSLYNGDYAVCKPILGKTKEKTARSGVRVIEPRISRQIFPAIPATAEPRRHGDEKCVKTTTGKTSVGGKRAFIS